MTRAVEPLPKQFLMIAAETGANNF